MRAGSLGMRAGDIDDVVMGVGGVEQRRKGEGWVRGVY